MTYNEFKENFLPELNSIRSFAGKIKYADQHLSRIGSGTGRVVYDVDDVRVLKIAKNVKGVAQNEAESGIGYYTYNHDIVTIIYDNADDDSWLLSEKAKKVNENRIKQLTGIPSLLSVYMYLKNYELLSNSRNPMFRIDNNVKIELDNNHFVEELRVLLSDHNLSSGDLGRPSSYGEVIRNGKPVIVVTDYGLNDEVYSTYYSKSKQSVYEMFNVTENEILSGKTKQRLWGLIPYDFIDGGDQINDSFIKFVLNRDKYPDKLIDKSPELVDEYYGCINNLAEVMNRVDDKKKFYLNLLELQNYLIRGNIFNGSPLDKEILSINEDEIPNIEAHSLDRSVADAIAKDFCEKIGLGVPNHLGGGGNGEAYLIQNNRVLKLTTDACEVDAAAKSQRAKPKTLVNVYNIYKIHDTERNVALYALIEDFIANKPKDEFVKYTELIDQLGEDLYGNLLMVLIKGKGRNMFAGKTLDDFPELAKLILTSRPEANVSEIDRKKAHDFMMGLYEIKKELVSLNIKSTDFMTLGNLGYKNGVLTYFDIGGCMVPEISIPNQNIVTLPENTVINEIIDRSLSDNIVKKLAANLKLNTPSYLNSGNYGHAYDIGDGRILKITSDKSEAMENLKLIGRKLDRIAQPYQVFSINSKTSNDEIYAIILEKLVTDSEYFKRMLHRLDVVFENVYGVQVPDAIGHYVFGYESKIDRNKVEKYFMKNPDDGKFFNSLIEIAKEAEKYGVDSLDYFNPNNLGYKKNGNIGFFDVGNSGEVVTNKKPTEINIDERIGIYMPNSKSVEVKKSANWQVMEIPVQLVIRVI